MTAACPAAETLSAYLDRELPRARDTVVADHVVSCQPCADTLDSLREVDALVRTASPLAPVALSAVFDSSRPRWRTPVAIAVGALALSAAAWGGSYAGQKLAGIFRTDRSVETRPTDEFPPSDWEQMETVESANPEFVPGATPVSDVRPVAEIEAALGTRLLQPAFVPEGYVLVIRRPLFDHGHAEFLYTKPGAATLHVVEENRTWGIVSNPPVPPEAAEQIEIDGRKAIYVRGGWSSDDEHATPRWDSDIAHSVMFDGGEMGVLLIVIDGPTTIPREDLIRMAESMR